MAKLSHNIEYAAAYTGVKLAQLLSPRLADAFGVGLGMLTYAVLSSRRRIARENLKSAFGDRLSDEEINNIVKGVFRNIGRTLIEFSRFRISGLAGIKKVVRGDPAPLEKVYAEGKGGIILTAHFGNWEMMGAWPAACGYPTDFLIGRQHNKKIDDLLIGFRETLGVGIISLAKSSRQVFKALKANHFTGIVSDQHNPAEGVVLDFFGRPAATPKGPALFAIRCGCPLLPCVLRRERYDRHTVIWGEPVYPPGSGDEEADIRTMTVAYTRFFEREITRYPDMWLWTHRRWKVKN
ncbi:MAG: lysophospholipid acyltransferase family protein [candidate division Zixibacteria bacterium]|nr:lysophospholipid acyltransferase family protein [candidate division Zixibacteria bacterium]MDD5426335.1 lysophospholipid acyltransferase family protein [candidate division Zixibacteria bacterium]